MRRESMVELRCLAQVELRTPGENETGSYEPKSRLLPSEYLAQGWCQEASAMEQNGDRIAPNHCKAKKWCFIGAMYASGIGTDKTTEGRRVFFSYRAKVMELLELPFDEIGLISNIANWNDKLDRTQAEVVALAWRVELALGLRLRCLAQVEPNDLIEGAVEPISLLRDGLVEELALVN